MDGTPTMEMSTAALAIPAGNRTSFNAAYNTLESAIRKFSKEKLMYEQRIEGLNNQITAAAESFQKLNLEHQNTRAENQKLLTLHGENEEHKIGLNAIIFNIESKLEIISETVEGLEKVEQAICSRYEDHSKCINSMKFKQVQLLQWVDEAQKKNTSLQNIAVELKSQLEKGEVEHGQQKSILLSEITMLKTSKGLLEVHLNSVKNEKELLLKSLEDIKEKSKFDLELQTNLHIQEKSALEDQLHEFKQASENLLEQQTQRHAQELNSVRQELLEHKKVAEEKAKLHDQEMESVRNELVEHKKFAEEEIKLHAQEMDSLHNELVEYKSITEERHGQELDSMRNKLIEYKITTAERHTQEMDSMRNELDEYKKTAEEDTKLHAQQMDCVQNELLEFKKIAEEEAKLHAQEKDSTRNELAEYKKSAEEETKLHAQEIESMQNELAEYKKIAEEESKLHAQEMDNMRSTVEVQLEQLSELARQIEEQIATFTKEKEGLTQEFEQKLLQVNKEKETLIDNHKIEMANLNQEYQLHKNDFRSLQKKYNDQKFAITKLVEEVGVRPLILPNADEDSLKARASVAPVPTFPFERPRTPLLRPVSKPVSPLTPSRVESSQSHGILKRPNDLSVADKNKNVSFGAPLVTDFIISSGSEADSDFTDSRELSQKRLKHNSQEEEERENIKDYKSGAEEIEKQKSKKSSSRRYIRHRIGQPRRNSSLI